MKNASLENEWDGHARGTDLHSLTKDLVGIAELMGRALLCEVARVG